MPTNPDYTPPPPLGEVLALPKYQMFPIQTGRVRGGSERMLIPWEVMAPHAAQAQTNHGQSLEWLAERGGLSPVETLHVLRHVRWHTDESRAIVRRPTSEVIEQIHRHVQDALLAQARTREGISAQDVQQWMDQHGYHSISAQGSVTLYDDDGDEGLTFEHLPSLEEAHALAQRFAREVPGPDDVGAEEATRQAHIWLFKHYPGGLPLRSADAMSITLETLQALSALRSHRFQAGGSREWSLLEWAGAMCGEAGEAANAAKKLLRYELAQSGNEASEHPITDRAALQEAFALELADTLMYVVLCANAAAIDLTAAARRCFNAKSEKRGAPERL